MRILIVNNFVRRGSGIDASVDLELRALASRGHEVTVLRRDNTDVDRATPARRAAMFASSLYSVGAYREMDRLLAHDRVDVVHLHNLVPFVTGAVYDACRRHDIPTVQHLRNYRAFCLSSYAFRNGRHCDDCAGTAFLACVAHRCYRRSSLASSGLVAARWIDWARGRRSGYEADAYIANSTCTRRLHVAHGLPADRIEVLHNPAEDLAALLHPPGDSPLARPSNGDPESGETRSGPAAKPKLTFVGSLIQPKGPWVALDLAAALPQFEVQFLGTGDDEPALKEAVRRRRLANVSFCGLLRGRDKAEAWAGSFLTVAPSLWDEPFGLVVPESFSLGVPVLATDAGGLAETVAAGRTGLRLDPARVDRAAAAVSDLWRDVARYERMRQAARAEYDARFTEAVFAARLEELLLRAARSRSGTRDRGRTRSAGGRRT